MRRRGAHSETKHHMTGAHKLMGEKMAYEAREVISGQTMKYFSHIQSKLQKPL